MIMIWLIFGAMALAALVFLAKPLFAAIPVEEDAELASYFAQIDTLRGNDTIEPLEAEDAIAGLQRQILERRDGLETRSPALFNVMLLVSVGVVGATVYGIQGRPDLTQLGAETATAQSAAAAPMIADTDRNAQLAALVEQLEERLNGAQSGDANGWLIYARSLMSLRRFDDAITAYDRVVLLTGGRLNIVQERDQARAYRDQRQATGGASDLSVPPTMDARPQRGPSEQDVRDAEMMSTGDRQAMIEGMVEGLAQRLEDDPQNAADWARLIRARQVLGQSEQAATDVARVRDIFKETPETVEQILSRADWSEE